MLALHSVSQVNDACYLRKENGRGRNVSRSATTGARRYQSLEMLVIFLIPRSRAGGKLAGTGRIEKRYPMLV